MNTPLIWLHDEALRMTHPVFGVAPVGAKVIFVWDDAYFRGANYSLKRLIFIYETLCELPVEIIQGPTLDVLRAFSPSALYVPATSNPRINAIIDSVKSLTSFQLVEEEAFAAVNTHADYTRFFKYWNAAEKSVFQKNGFTDI